MRIGFQDRTPGRAGRIGLSAPARRTLRSIHLAAGLRGFAAHAAIFAIVLASAYLTGGDRHFFWPLLGWTIGLSMHAFAALGPGQYLHAPWEGEGLRVTGLDRTTRPDQNR